jgi:osmotically-inducible protein OsmY
MIGKLVLIAAIACAGGCSIVQEKTFGESIDEAATGSEIKARLFAAGGLARFGEVDVEVADRFVLLSGRTPSDADRTEAERIAWTAAAVDEVANEIIVTRRDIGRDVNDRWITEQVRARLIADDAIKGVNYNIQVFEGVVFLLGFASSGDELRRAAEQAAAVKDVVRVVSYVKMRDRSAPPTFTGARRSADAAPIAGPDRPPSRRGVYPDPYGAAPADLTRGSAPVSPRGEPLQPLD